MSIARREHLPRPINHTLRDISRGFDRIKSKIDPVKILGGLAAGVLGLSGYYVLVDAPNSGPITQNLRSFSQLFPTAQHVPLPAVFTNPGGSLIGQGAPIDGDPPITTTIGITNPIGFGQPVTITLPAAGDGNNGNGDDDPSKKIGNGNGITKTEVITAAKPNGLERAGPPPNPYLLEIAEMNQVFNGIEYVKTNIKSVGQEGTDLQIKDGVLITSVKNNTPYFFSSSVFNTGRSPAALVLNYDYSGKRGISGDPQIKIFGGSMRGNVNAITIHTFKSSSGIPFLDLSFYRVSNFNNVSKLLHLSTPFKMGDSSRIEFRLSADMKSFKIIGLEENREIYNDAFSSLIKDGELIFAGGVFSPNNDLQFSLVTVPPMTTRLREFNVYTGAIQAP